MKLPKTSKQEELEQLSKDRLRPLFSHASFEIREEVYRDKGIDLTIELKHNNFYTNFRFLIQLKSTESKSPNKDDSYSWQIDTSNIQYLLNGGLPAYYICYVKSIDKFYVKQLNEFVRELSLINDEWHNQESHTLRIDRVLNDELIKSIYDEVKTRCEASRILNDRLHITSHDKESRKVHITSDYDITDEASIIEYIEIFGIELCNQGKSSLVVSLSEKVTDTPKSTQYYATVGVAHYHSSNYFEALSYFRKSKVNRSDTGIKENDYITLFEAKAKFAIGILSYQEYKEILKSLENSKFLSEYTKTMVVVNNYLSNIDSEDSFPKFREEIVKIGEDYSISENARFQAKCEYLYYWGDYLNTQYIQNVAMINAIEEFDEQINSSIRQKFINGWGQIYLEWESYLKKLEEELHEADNFVSIGICKLQEMKIRFQTIVSVQTIKFELKNSNLKLLQDIDQDDALITISNNAANIAKRFHEKGYVDNAIVALSLRYEVLKYQHKNDNAEAIKSEILSLIEEHSLKESLTKVSHLFNQGGYHDMLIKMLNDKVIKRKNDIEEYKNLVKEMEELDDKEEQDSANTNKEDLCYIQLFPIGHFGIPESRLDGFLDILAIDSYKLVKALKSMMENRIIPVINIFKRDIKEEGYGGGMYDDEGIESWRRIRDIRAKLFEAKFKRQNIR
ncbi:DUF4365 domain-containing protein [Dysgonomonas sp. BGC7]|uniref:DUF4365 domain-containing protein n=1 Tax=Dysgonomonas sp. BGC7 TaxID=1658008 RepID=UPI0006802FD2|nr:DUF4365 domain-containing protein [Dysgonomonas sp. BGC7]MBD8387789.1 DUF4365 domain-containing protein [Dysgonomonas sp. BGC7]